MNAGSLALYMSPFTCALTGITYLDHVIQLEKNLGSNCKLLERSWSSMVTNGVWTLGEVFLNFLSSPLGEFFNSTALDVPVKRIKKKNNILERENEHHYFRR